MAEQKKGWFDVVKSSYVWKSVFRHEYQDTYRNRVLQVSSNVFLHLHPTKIRRHALRLRFTWCMGGITFLLFLIETVTGIILMFYYRPTGEYAYHDMKYLQFDVPFGMIMRNMHRWGAHAMVIAVWLHMFRVFMTGSYKPPREFNWVIGVLLLVVTFLLSFTGYLLPWDQLAYWAITVGTQIGGAAPIVGPKVDFLLKGGKEIGQPTLIRFYTLHVIFLPLIAAFLMAVHFWRIRKDGGISGPL